MDTDLIRAQSRLQSDGWWFRGRADIALDLLPYPDGSRDVIDVGCGWGGLTSQLGPWGRVLGVEPSEAAREEAQRRGVDVVAGEADKLPLDDSSADLAVATDVIEHLDDDLGALREIVRVLRPGGMALITVPAYPRLFSSHDRALEHRRRYTRRGLRAALEAAGLRPLRVTHFNALLLPVAVPARLLGRRGSARADSGRAPGLLNGLMYRVFRSEKVLLRRLDLPFGLSIAALASRPADGKASRSRELSATTA